MVKDNYNDEVSLHAYSIQHALTKPASCIPHQLLVSHPALVIDSPDGGGGVCWLEGGVRNLRHGETV